MKINIQELPQQCELISQLIWQMRLEKLNEMIGIPNGLAQMGVTEDMIPKLVKHSITDPSNLTTPRLPNQEEWEKLFLESM
jgi:4-hydroxybutyrate dehydrogenase